MRFLLSFLFLIKSFIIFSQDVNTDKVTAKEFTIPANPVFDLMGVTPSQVSRLSDIRDFKVDWSFKSWKLNPNLAIQGQPVWEIMYNRKNLAKYQQASAFMRKLSTIDISLGTVQNEENDRRIGFAAKINIIRQKDPLLVKTLYDDIELKYKTEQEEQTLLLATLERTLDTTQNILEKPAIREQIQSTEQQLYTVNSRRQSEINDRVRIYNAENWNAASLDIAFGKIYTYQTDTAGGLKGLRLNRNTASGIWINGGVGISRKVFISGLIRSSFYEELLQFQLQDDGTGEVTGIEAIAKNTLFTFGFNMRYGNAVYNIFAEFVHERKGLNTPVNALKDVFDPPAGKTVIESTVKWNIVHPYSINIGGDWRVNRNVILNYGVRWLMDKTFRTTTFTPVVNIACMMR